MYCPSCHADYPADWKTCPKDSTALLTSPQIGKYTIDGMLGVGGMGAVYRAKNPDTGAAVAVKVMNREVAAAQDARERFKREAGAVSRLDTAHVCKVYDFGSEPDGTLYLVMELMKGHTLREEIVSGPDYMDLARVQMVMTGALKGLAAAHANGIVHRDLKPENIFVADTFDGEVPKLLDFGIARVASSKDANLTRTGTMMGTASYMAPEQVAGETDQMGSWTDTYAMGAILYEMLAGAPAFGGSTLSEVLTRVIKGESVPLSMVRSGLPDAVYQLIDRCLSRETANRPPDADAMRRALVATGLANTTTVPPPSKTKVEPSEVPATVAATALGVPSAAEVMQPSTPPMHVVTAPTPVQPPVSLVPAAVASSAEVAAPKNRSLVPLIAIGVVVIGGGIAFLATRGGGDRKDERTLPPADAIAVLIDAPAPVVEVQAPPPDAGVEVASGPCPAGMVHVPAATFTMGNNAKLGGEADSWSGIVDARPEHQVTLSAYCIDKTEVTVDAYAKCAAAGGCAPIPLTVHITSSQHVVGVTGDAAKSQSHMCNGNHPGRKNHPANCVEWTHSKAYCEWASKRLPTEAEWEYAARGTDRRKHPWGNEPHDSNVHGGTHGVTEVGKFPANASPFGVLDMQGSVKEWVGDFYGPYTSAAQIAPTGAKRGDRRVVRDSDFVVFRGGLGLEDRYFDLGFRCAREAAKAANAPDPAGSGASAPLTTRMAEVLTRTWVHSTGFTVSGGNQGSWPTTRSTKLAMKVDGESLKGTFNIVLSIMSSDCSTCDLHKVEAAASGQIRGRLVPGTNTIDIELALASAGDLPSNWFKWCGYRGRLAVADNQNRPGHFVLKGTLAGTAWKDTGYANEDGCTATRCWCDSSYVQFGDL